MDLIMTMILTTTVDLIMTIITVNQTKSGKLMIIPADLIYNEDLVMIITVVRTEATLMGTAARTKVVIRSLRGDGDVCRTYGKFFIKPYLCECR
jgi:hypothetical protein